MLMIIRYVLLLLPFRLLKSPKSHYLVKPFYLVIRLGVGKLFLLCNCRDRGRVLYELSQPLSIRN